MEFSISWINKTLCVCDFGIGFGMVLVLSLLEGAIKDCWDLKATLYI